MEGKMKVLMTTDTIGGVWVYSLELCRALKKYDVEIHLAAMGSWPSQEQEQEAAAIGTLTLYKSDYKLEWMDDPWEDFKRAQKWLTSIYHTIHPDLVHFNNYAHAKKDWTCPTITVFHSCVQTWWQAVKGCSAPSSYDQYTQVVHQSLNESDVVVGPTKSILKRAQEVHQIETELQVIHNARSQDYETGRKENIILCIGRIWDEGKNLKLLAAVAEQLPWPVYIAGSNINPDTGKPVKFNNIHFLGSLRPQEVKDWMEKAKIFVSPTKYEPFGLAILEAARAGCALVLSELDTLRELWGGDAAFFDPCKAQEGKQQILRVIEDQNLLEELSDRAKKRAQQYTTDKMGHAYYELYQTSIKKKEELKMARV